MYSLSIVLMCKSLFINFCVNIEFNICVEYENYLLMYDYWRLINYNVDCKVILTTTSCVQCHQKITNLLTCLITCKDQNKLENFLYIEMLLIFIILGNRRVRRKLYNAHIHNIVCRKEHHPPVTAKIIYDKFVRKLQ